MGDLIVDLNKSGLEMKKEIIRKYRLNLKPDLIRVREKMGERLGRVYDSSLEMHK